MLKLALRIVLAVVASLAATAVLPAQEALVRAAEQRALALDKSLREDILAWQQEQMAAYERRVAEAKKRGDATLPAFSMRPPPRLVENYLESVEKELATLGAKDEAIPFLARMVSWASGADAPKKGLAAAERLTSEFLLSPHLGDYLDHFVRGSRLFAEGELAQLLDKVATKNPHGAVKAQALVLRYRDTIEQAPLESAEYRSARAALVRVRELVQGSAPRVAIDQLLAGRESMAEGSVAPEIEGLDLDGVAFKLTDYKGKIVLLSFWGHW